MLRANSSLLIDRDLSVPTTRMAWLTGHIDGDTTKGKISYLGGHGYSTALPISTNPQTNGVRLFLNGLYETPGLSAADQPVVTVVKTAPATTNAVNFTFTLDYANSGPGPVFAASLVDVLPPGTTFVSATGGGVNAAGTVTWPLGTLARSAAGSVTVTVSAPEGTYANRATLSYTVGMTQKSVASNITSTIVDRTAPNATLTSTPAALSNSASANFTFTSTEAGTFECSLDGAAFALCTTPAALAGLVDGSHIFQVRARDAATNIDATPASFSWTVDTTAPNTTLTSTPPGLSNSASANFTFTATEPGTFECSLDGGAFALCTTPAALADATPATASWIVDALVPDTTITSGPTGTVGSTDAAFTFSSTKPSSTFECSLDGAAFTACASPDALTGLVDGNHTFSVRAVDAVGNVDPAPATRTWTVDTQPPETTLTVQPPVLTSDTSGTFEFLGSEPGLTFECSLDGAMWTACSSPFTTTGTLADGVHVLLVRAVDVAGNVDLTPTRATWEVDTIAPPAPSLTEPVAGATTGSLPRFGGLGEVGSTVTVTINGTTVCTALVDLAGRWSCNASTPLTVGPHTAIANAADGAGNTSPPSLPRAFGVGALQPDTVILTGPAALTNVARADFTVKSDVVNSTFECSLDGAPFTPCSTALSFTVTDGVHHLAIRAVDNGLVDVSPATWDWTLDSTPPGAPVLTSPAANGTTSATPTFTGTAEPGSTVWVSIDGQPACTAIADAMGNFSCAAPSALPPGPHVVNAAAKDPAGNSSPPSIDVAFTVGGTPLDTAIIAGPSGTVSSTSAGFSFTSTVLGATFECSLDGAVFTACPTPVTLSGLAAGSHTLEVRAVDGASVDASPASRTWVIDSGGPTAPTVVAPADQSILRTRTPRYSGTAEPGSTVIVSVDDRVACVAVADSSGAWECFGTTDLAEGAHLVAAVAIDAAGNGSAQSMVNRFVIDIPAMIVTILAPANASLTNDATPAISGTSTPGATVSVFLDGLLLGTAVADSTGAWTLTPRMPIADGAHALTATAELGGLVSPPSTTVNLTIDTRAPVVTVTLTQENTQTPPDVRFAADESPVTFTCSLDGAAFTPCSSPLDVTAAGDGNHTLVVRATDAAGNTGEVTLSYVVTAPIITRPAIGLRGGGCGCGTTDGLSGVLTALALLLLAARRSRRGLRRAATIGAVILTANVASAQVAGFDIERLDLNPGGTASLVSGTGDLMRKGAWRASLLMHYEHDPLVLYRLDTNERLGAIVGSRLSAHLVGAWAPLDWLEVGLQLPIVLFQGGDELSAWDVAPAATPALGTPWITGRFAVLREGAGAPLDMAIQLGLGLPFGNAAAFTDTTPVAFAPRVGLGKSMLGWLRLGAELGFMVRGTPAVLAQTGTASAFNFALSATTRGEGLRGEVTLRGAMALDAPRFGGELLFGASYPLGKWVELFALGGPGLGTLPGNPAFRVLAGVAVQPPAEVKPPAVPVRVVQRCDDSVSIEVLRAACATLDADGDGITNGDDACPRVAGVVAAQGCLLPDADDDGLTDDVDECPKEAGLRERKGCPIRDRDGDGVEDPADQCPAEAGLVERQGCPVRDTDADGVEDPVDACPAEAGPVERKGCPFKDQDGDTVEDALDNCPTVKGVPENAGCPAKQKQLVIITADRLVIREAVYFATGKAAVLPRSWRLLDNVAEVLLAHPEIALVRIEGHTDSSGVREKNLALSQARADAVKALLVARKVPTERLKAVGFGPDKPNSTNATAKGREANRRVEFNFEHSPSR